MNIQEKYINRCLQLAKKGLGYTRPNPMVGCVIVHNERIIGEGFTSPYGGAHAEVNAIKSVKNKGLLKESTLYVSLEPCSHTGKTPPCTNLIKTYGFKKVVVGCVDPNEVVNGSGISQLRAAGIEVEVGVLRAECIELNRRFFTFQREKRPFIRLKWAETMDGYFDRDRAQAVVGPYWISNVYAQQMVHQFRAEEQAILVGTTTVLNDNPSLTVRTWAGQNPVKVIIDRSLKVPNDAAVFNGGGKVLVFTEQNREDTEVAQYIVIDFQQSIAHQIGNQLYRLGIQSILIEGGAQTLQTFIDAELWDEAYVFKGDVRFEKGLEAPVIKNVGATTRTLINNEFLVFKRYND
ncbi:bifunctional diaminohydroxyphosphoribosylaminopyrimidine deaminase/5-amino-6-(5-phosphoribosylamino)uracil reductase RibD [Flavobacteriaceae bacterium F08102]|nr:bifunctional diaminohydroxyphosphoribosylaminopyrimidine deaminase/5-amino-6-(5-phosphoribosylamino)uracil reductase RibD [Flavobacteriaceae bacterium F08102]